MYFCDIWVIVITTSQYYVIVYLIYTVWCCLWTINCDGLQWWLIKRKQYLIGYKSRDIGT